MSEPVVHAPRTHTGGPPMTPLEKFYADDPRWYEKIGEKPGWPCK